jgi:hypothetical protein
VPRTPTFSRDMLIELLRSGEYSSHAELAAALSTPERAVTANAVAVAVLRLRQQPEFADLPAFQVRHGETLVAALERNAGVKVGARVKNHVLLQRLRQISALRDERHVPDDVTDLAIRFEQDLRDKSYVVDLDNEGRPFIRPAMFPDEVDSTGNMVDIIAQHRRRLANCLWGALCLIR